MSIFYNIFIATYTTLIRMAGLFNPKARAWVAGRRGWKKELDGFTGNEKIAWFHAASLGEFEQGRPVMEAFRQLYPDHRILLTFFSPSGYEQKKNFKGADKVMYLPADCRRNARYFVKVLKPSIAIFIKYEFWYNYLAELHRNHIPAVFISVLFRPHQPFFKWYGGWFRNKLSTVAHFFLQDEESLKMAQSLGIERTSVSGDTRFDRVADILANKTENSNVKVFCSGRKVLLAGSTWPPDESLLATLAVKYPDLCFIVAPHEVSDDRIRQVADTFGMGAAFYTRDDPATWRAKRLLVIDTIGVLSSIYRYADIAYIGGAFGSGLHNIQEPAVNGIPVIFGPGYHKFREAVDLVKLGGAFSVSSADELDQVAETLLSDDAKYRDACEINRTYMLQNTGATKKIIEGLRQYCS